MAHPMTHRAFPMNGAQKTCPKSKMKSRRRTWGCTQVHKSHVTMCGHVYHWNHGKAERQIHHERFHHQTCRRLCDVLSSSLKPCVIRLLSATGQTRNCTLSTCVMWKNKQKEVRLGSNASHNAHDAACVLQWSNHKTRRLTGQCTWILDPIFDSLCTKLLKSFLKLIQTHSSAFGTAQILQPFQKASRDKSCCNGIEKATVPVKKIPARDRIWKCNGRKLRRDVQRCRGFPQTP